MSDRPLTLVEKFQGALLGAAVGDALGLPREGLSPSRATRLFGTAPLKHSLVFHKGLTSDDTEHACMVGQSLLVSHDNPTLFARVLAWKLRFWLLGLPAGVGFATLRSILKLWLGFSPQSSGVFSAGNGPAMRAPILGVYASSLPDPKTFLQQFVTASTQITHSDPPPSTAPSPSPSPPPTTPKSPQSLPISTTSSISSNPNSKTHPSSPSSPTWSTSSIKMPPSISTSNPQSS